MNAVKMITHINKKLNSWWWYFLHSQLYASAKKLQHCPVLCNSQHTKQWWHKVQYNIQVKPEVIEVPDDSVNRQQPHGHFFITWNSILSLLPVNKYIILLGNPTYYRSHISLCYEQHKSLTW